jgi:hypothetical protein
MDISKINNVDGDKIILYNTTMFTFIIPLIQITCVKITLVCMKSLKTRKG